LRCLAEVGRDYRSVLILNERHVICIGRYSALEGPLAMVPEAGLEQCKRTLALPALFATSEIMFISSRRIRLNRGSFY